MLVVLTDSINLIQVAEAKGRGVPLSAFSSGEQCFIKFCFWFWFFGIFYLSYKAKIQKNENANSISNSRKSSVEKNRRWEDMSIDEKIVVILMIGFFLGNWILITNKSHNIRQNKKGVHVNQNLVNIRS